MKKIIQFIICLLIPLAVGGLSGFATSKNIESWHQYLIKPWFNPPNYLFGPVWTSLYLLMGISFFIIVNKTASEQRNKAFIAFFIQLTLNFMWSFIFFQFHQIGLAFIEIILLWFAILWMMVQFYKVDKLAAYLNIPYLLWVSFASVLNFAIWNLNK